MKILKYVAGSLIISFGILMVLLILLRAGGAATPDAITNHFILIWIALAAVVLPFAKKVIRA